MKGLQFYLLFLTVAALSGCASIPTGPSVMVLPGEGKPFEVFQSDDYACRQWAGRQTGAAPSGTANETLATGAAIGAVTGAVIGAAGSHHAGAGALVGAGLGALGGAAVASGPASSSQWELQRRYDIAYQQCMYSKGNSIPGVVRNPRRAYRVPPPPGFRSPPSPPPQPQPYPLPPPPAP